MQLAQRSDRATQLKTAEHFASCGDQARAAVLFQAAGAQSRAIAVALAADESGAALAQIAASLDDQSTVDPQTLLDLAEVRRRGREPVLVGVSASWTVRAGLGLCESDCALRVWPAFAQ